MEDLVKKQTSQPFSVQTAKFSPAIRVILIIVAILFGLYFAVGFVITGLVFVALLPTIHNIFAMDVLSGIISVVTYLGPAILYLILCVLSGIFTKRLLKKQPISWKLLIAYGALIVLNIVFERLVMLILQLISARIGTN